MKITKSDLLSVLIGTAIIVLLLIPIFCRYPNYGWINNSILGLTAIVILWYTRETEAMKRETEAMTRETEAMKAEVAKQNKLQLRPILILSLEKGLTPLLKNEGKGPALNSVVTEFTIQYMDDEEDFKTRGAYKIIVPSYISPDSKHEFKIFLQDKQIAIKTTEIDPKVMNEIFKVVKMTIRYEDIEGSTYRSKLRVGSGRIDFVSFDNSKY